MIDLDRLRRSGEVDEDIEGEETESSNPLGLPFDPSRIGPRDIVRGLLGWIGDHAVGVVATSIVSLFAYAWLNLTYGFAISLPTWLWVSILSIIGAGLITIYPIKRLIDWLDVEDSYTLVDQNPVDGELGVHELSAEKWSRLTVYDRSGETRSTNYLHQVTLLSGGTGYEVDGYDPGSNVAVSSWMAGASNRDFRRYERAVNLVKRQLSREAEISVDELIEAPEAIREVGSETVHEIIRVAEGIEAPSDTVVSDRLTELVESHEETVNNALEDTTVSMTEADEDDSISIDDIVGSREASA